MAVLDPISTPPASCPAFLGRRKANRRPTSGCAVTSEAGLGPVTIWAGGQPQVRQEGVALAQRLQLLALTQRGPCAVLGTQRGLGCCRAGTHTHIHTERDTPLEGVGAAEGGPRQKPDALRWRTACGPHSDPAHAAQAQGPREPETLRAGTVAAAGSPAEASRTRNWGLIQTPGSGTWTVPQAIDEWDAVSALALYPLAS